MTCYGLQKETGLQKIDTTLNFQDQFLDFAALAKQIALRGLTRESNHES